VAVPPAGSSLQRTLFALSVGVLTFAILAFFMPWQFAAPAGWCAANAVFLLRVWPDVRRLTPIQVERLAATEDDTRATAGTLLLGAAIGSLLGVGFALHKAARSDDTMEAALTAIALSTVVLSWLVVNTVYALRYAHLYYEAPVGGIDFPEGPPDYYDFAYLAFTIGMTYQVSDTGLLSKRFRRTLLGHAMLSYLFGTVIIATLINTVAGFVVR